MSIDSGAFLHAIQFVNQKIDSSHGTLDTETSAVVKATLNKLPKMGLVTVIDKIALAALVSRMFSLLPIEELSVIKPLHERIYRSVSSFFKSDFTLHDFKDFLPNHLIGSAERIETVLSQCPQDREQVLILAAPFIKESMDGPEIVEILQSVELTPHKERSDLCLAASRIINQNMSARTVCLILNAIGSLPSSERKSICDAALIFIKGTADPYEIVIMLEVIGEIPEQERAGVLVAAAPFIQKTMDVISIAGVLEVISRISLEERMEVCLAASNMIKEEISGSAKIGILNGVANVLKKNREEISLLIGDIIKKCSDYIGVNLIFKSVAKIPEKDRKSICLAARSLIQEEMSAIFIVKILSAVAGISQDDREDICNVLAHIIEEYLVDPNEICGLIAKLQEIRSQDKARVFTCLKKITSYGNEYIEEHLLNILIENASLAEYGKAQAFLIGDTPALYRTLPSILPAKWMSDIKKEASLFNEEDKAIGDRAISDLFGFFKKSKRPLKDVSSRLMQSYLLAVIALEEVSGITSLRKLQILSCICKEKEVMAGLGLIYALCGRKETKALKDFSLESPIVKLKEEMRRAFIKDRFIDLSDIENFEDKYLRAFSDTRMPFALEIYMVGLRLLGDEHARKTVERLIRSILLGTFESQRYDISLSPHLKRIQEYDDQNRQTILANWKSLTCKAPVLLESAACKEKQFSFEEFFKKKLLDGHCIKHGIEQLPILSSFLRDDPSERLGLLSLVTEKVDAMQASLKAESNFEEKKKIAQLLKLAQSEKSCMELVLTSDLSKEQQIKKIEGVAAALSPLELEIAADLGGLARIFRAAERTSVLETVELCKGWEDLFLSGSEIEGSCQRIDGDPDLNKCLLAYCLDGKNAMLAVKDPGGKLLARSMLRLLWDEAENKPVLFLDRLYPYPSTQERELAIRMAAIECAKELSLELFTSGGVGFLSEKEIASLGSSCPYEYADAADGVMLNGLFKIRNLINVDLY